LCGKERGNPGVLFKVKYKSQIIGHMGPFLLLP